MRRSTLPGFAAASAQEPEQGRDIVLSKAPAPTSLCLLRSFFCVKWDLWGLLVSQSEASAFWERLFGTDVAHRHCPWCSQTGHPSFLWDCSICRRNPWILIVGSFSVFLFWRRQPSWCASPNILWTPWPPFQTNLPLGCGAPWYV